MLLACVWDIANEGQGEALRCKTTALVIIGAAVTVIFAVLK